MKNFLNFPKKAASPKNVIIQISEFAWVVGQNLPDYVRLLDLLSFIFGLWANAHLKTNTILLLIIQELCVALI